MPYTNSPDVESAAALLDAHPDYRVLRALPPIERLRLSTPKGTIRTAIILDTETTSLDPQTGSIIELAMCAVRFDQRGHIIDVGPVHDWLEDPGHPLSPAISKLTGLTDADLQGRSIDDAMALSLLLEADLIIAHHAAFDAAWIERRYPAIKGKAWCCSLKDIDWRGHGYEALQLGALLGDVAGYFNRRHRADADVAALVALLTTALPPGHPVSAEIILTAMQPTVRVTALSAPFEVKGQLKERGYRWDPKIRSWWIEVKRPQAEMECAWLADNAFCTTPILRPISWFERHRV